MERCQSALEQGSEPPNRPERLSTSAPDHLTCARGRCRFMYTAAAGSESDVFMIMHPLIWLLEPRRLQHPGVGLLVLTFNSTKLLFLPLAKANVSLPK